jgi:hypothetical protein
MLDIAALAFIADFSIEIEISKTISDVGTSSLTIVK